MCKTDNLRMEGVFILSTLTGEDRTPRIYPWMNEPGGGIIPPWNIKKNGSQCILSSVPHCLGLQIPLPDPEFWLMRLYSENFTEAAMKHARR